MGQALVESSAAARDVFERADAALGFSISKLCFDGPADELTLTENTQPAILTTSIAALAALKEKHPQLADPSFAAGHSLGEYSALVAAGGLELEDAVRLVNLRGKAMQVAVPAGVGGMSAILGGDEDAVRELCSAAIEGEEVLSPANFNSPGQIAIAGHVTALKRAGALAKERKLKVMPLPVSAPFHCALMEPAARAVETALAKVSIAEPRFPIISNVEATPVSEPERIRELLVRQVDGPVLWEQSVRALFEAGVRSALELGHGKVISGLVKRIEKGISVTPVNNPETVESALQSAE